MKKWSLLAILCSAVTLFMACEKTIDFNLKSENNKIVVEGVIEKDQLPYVSLTNSLGFFDKIDLSNVKFVSGAIVRVYDLTTNDMIQLKEYNIDTTIGTTTFSFSIYGPDLLDAKAMNFKGQEEHSYRLTVQTNTVFAEAVTKIPTAIKLDSIWLEPVPGKENEFKSFKGLYNDPDTFGNCLKYQTLNHKYVKTGEAEIYYDPFTLAYDDAVINGTKFPITFDLGFDKNQTYTNDELFNQAYVKRGDTVTLKCSSIDRSVYKFWSTLNISQNSVGNPFATPLKIQGNVKNALGVWSGLGTSYFTLIDSIK